MGIVWEVRISEDQIIWATLHTQSWCAPLAQMYRRPHLIRSSSFRSFAIFELFLWIQIYTGTSPNLYPCRIRRKIFAYFSFELNMTSCIHLIDYTKADFAYFHTCKYLTEEEHTQIQSTTGNSTNLLNSTISHTPLTPYVKSNPKFNPQKSSRMF